MKRIALVATLLVALAGFALAGCGSSPEDKARDDGKDVGKAVRAVRDSTSVDEAKQALGELKTALSDLHSDTKDHVKDQVSTIQGQIQGSIDTAQATGNVADAKASLQSSAQNVRAQADAFRNGNNSIANEFWRGVEEGYDGD